MKLVKNSKITCSPEKPGTEISSEETESSAIFRIFTASLRDVLPIMTLYLKEHAKF